MPYPGNPNWKQPTATGIRKHERIVSTKNVSNLYATGIPGSDFDYKPQSHPSFRDTSSNLGSDGVKAHGPRPLRVYDPKLNFNSDLFDWEEFILAHLQHVSAKATPDMPDFKVAQTVLYCSPKEEQIIGITVIGGRKVRLSAIQAWQHLQHMGLKWRLHEVTLPC